MNKITSKEQIKVLLENTAQEVRSVLLNSSQQTNKYFYENFTTVSLKGLKYIGNYIDLLNKDQQMQRIIGRLIKEFADSLKEYKARNIYIHSTHLQEEEENEEDDEIYHFMNTRNNLLAAECLSNYDNEKQRKELQEFVQQISKKKLPQKESKRSLLLPKDNSFNLKLGRKTTFDPDIFMRETQENPPVQNVPFPAISQTVQIQTELEEEECQQKKSEIEIQVVSQCESMLPSEGATLQNIVTSKLKTSNSLKKKEKKKPNEDQKKKKTKFFPTSNKSRDKDGKQKKEECSLKLVKTNQPCLCIKSKEVDIIINNSTDVSEKGDSQETNKKLEEIPIISQNNQQNPSNETLDLQKKPSIQGQQIEQIAKAVDQTSNESKQELTNSKSDNHFQPTTLTKSKKNIISKASPLSSQFQKIPTSGIRILESSTTDNNQSISSTKEGQLKPVQNRMGCMKKKRFTGDRHLFQAYNLTEGNNEKLNTSVQLRASKLMLAPQLVKKTSNQLEKKNNQSFASTPSQDYLASRQESQPCSTSDKSEQSVLQPMRIPRRSLQSCIKSINFNGQRRTSHNPNDFSSTSKENPDRMIIISNQQTEDPNIFQNNTIQSTIGKENTSEKGLRAKHSFLKRSYLHTISEAKSSEDSSRLLISKLRQANRSVELSPNEPNKSKFYRLSSQKAQFRQTTSLLTHKDGHSRYGESSSCHSNPFQLGQVKRALRNRASKVKLQHYLQLIETMHQKLCGANCQHIKQIRQAKQGDVGEQLLRLLTHQK